MDIKHEIIVNRYRNIISKISKLDEQYQKNTNLAYKTLLSLTTFVILSKLAFSEGKIDFLTLELAIKSTGLITILFFVYLVLLSVSHLLSWYDLRQEECELLKKMDLNNLINSPAWKNIYRWSEFYFIILCIIISLIGLYLFLNPNSIS